MASFRTTGKKIVAIGRNYAAHIKELGNATPVEPFFFLKPTSSYIDGKEVLLPRGFVVHHEVELGVVIGKGGRDIKAEDWKSHVAGYILAIDHTARNVQDAAKSKGLPWSAAKGFDHACAVGDFIPVDEVKDPHKLDLWYKVNGETKQSDSTGLMLRRIPELIEFSSSLMTFEEGDVLLTGTPAGVGPIQDGDKITAGLEQEGKVLSKIEHLVRNREGGYLFKG